MTMVEIIQIAISQVIMTIEIIMEESQTDQKM